MSNEFYENVIPLRPNNPEDIAKKILDATRKNAFHKTHKKDSFFLMDEKMSEISLDNRVTHLEEGFKGLNDRFDKLENKLDAKFDKIEAKFDALADKVNTVNSSLVDKINKQENNFIELKSTLVTLRYISTYLMPLVTAIVVAGISYFLKPTKHFPIN
ncbi:hypothetical protein B488_06230 [Liberibacter crescens BT-1]|uniref:Uncharacterized protein n=2 Tax=Liberibacter crescens TaxID=1273132 RepID=L0EUV1_LIBCB|nr:hypothetical protein [Liberibacter crescens]AGA64615.1 hypothetical protein B488_06230 [Liberibacter crescens BT-1]AMC12735.1 hypothetical protein RL73_03230 [Liberibacter crescens]